jgi:hypothetical protein
MGWRRANVKGDGPRRLQTLLFVSISLLRGTLDSVLRGQTSEWVEFCKDEKESDERASK